MLKLHQKRNAMSVTSIARLVIHRISIHGIFMLNEQQQQINIILTSLRTQVMKEQELRAKLKKKHADIDRKIEQLKGELGGGVQTTTVGRREKWKRGLIICL